MSFMTIYQLVMPYVNSDVGDDVRYTDDDEVV